MAVEYKTQDGRSGILDVAVMLQAEGARITGVQGGVIHYQKEGNIKGLLSIGDWAAEEGVQITAINGFNLPQSALPEPPQGLTPLDQLSFYMDGADITALQELYPNATETPDGRVVILDVDGFWREMWSPLWQPPAPAETYEDRVNRGAAVDTTLAMRYAAVQFIFGLAGVEPRMERNNNFAIRSLADALKVIARNAPEESKIILGRFIHQTAGLDPWKWNNALLAPEETAQWLREALKMTSFQFRMRQAQMAELILKALHEDSKMTFVSEMKALIQVKETKKLMVNMKAVTSEFISFMVGLDLIRDISRTTGLQEWIELAENAALDPSKLPPMPEFVPKFVRLLKWIMPMAREPRAAVASGKKGLEGIISLMVMIDDCIYCLSHVPDSSAKQKMFMGLKRLQTSLENKLSYFYQPSPEDNRDGLRENAFMMIKERYSTKREAVYRLVQVPKEAWNNTFLEMTRDQASLEQFYQSVPPIFSDMIKSFVSMDAAYDMQPWVDADHARRTNDAFSQMHESFGLPPPEAGYLAKNSPRACIAIVDALAQAAGMLQSMDKMKLKEMIRSPNLMANMMKMIMAAAVSQEVGAVEIMGKMGIGGMTDPMGSPDPFRIWEDPDLVMEDNIKQVEEIMGQMMMEQAQKNQQAQAQGQAMQAQEQQMMQQQQGGPEKAGAGPNAPSNVIPMAR